MTAIQGVPATGNDAEQTRARYPDAEGYVDQDGVRVFWERYGEGESAILFLPTWEIGYSRVWKCQIPYFSRRCRVVTFDPRGNGRSDRPLDVRAYDRRRYAEDAIAVLDAADVERAAVVSWCGGSEELMLAAEHPERVTSLVAIAPNLLLTEDPEQQAGYSFDDVLDTDEGWAKSNRHYWQRDWRGYLEFFTRGCTPSLTRPSRSRMGSAGVWRPTRRRFSSAWRPNGRTIANRHSSCARGSAARRS